MMFKNFFFIAFISIICLDSLVLGGNNELLKRLRVININLDVAFAKGCNNYRVKGTWPNLGTRLFNSPLPNGDLLVGWNGADSVGRVSYLQKDKTKGYILKKTVEIEGRHVRGIAALSDGSFGVLAHQAEEPVTNSRMYVQKWSSIKADGNPTKKFETELSNSEIPASQIPNLPTDFHIGDSRMELGKDNEFYVYYHVESIAEYTQGVAHQGDTYFRVNSETGEATRLWAWGCSHSMSNLLSFHPLLSETLAVCVTDCYPATSTAPGTSFETDSIGGIFTERRNLLQTMAGGCDGCVGGELGMAAPLYDGGWAIIFNSHRNAASKGQAACKGNYNQDVGVVFAGKNKQLSGSVKWLTQTSEDESDPGLARYGAFCGSKTCKDHEQDGPKFLVGWKKTNTRYLALMDATGNIELGPVDATNVVIDGVSTKVSWGARDDTWRTIDDGSVVWLEAPDTSKPLLRVFVLDYTGPITPSDPSSSTSPTNPSSSKAPVNPSSSTSPTNPSSSKAPTNPSSSKAPTNPSSSNAQPTDPSKVAPISSGFISIGSGHVLNPSFVGFVITFISFFLFLMW